MKYKYPQGVEIDLLEAMPASESEIKRVFRNSLARRGVERYSVVHSKKDAIALDNRCQELLYTMRENGVCDFKEHYTATGRVRKREWFKRKSDDAVVVPVTLAWLKQVHSALEQSKDYLQQQQPGFPAFAMEQVAIAVKMIENVLTERKK